MSDTSACTKMDECDMGDCEDVGIPTKPTTKSTECARAQPNAHGVIIIGAPTTPVGHASDLRGTLSHLRQPMDYTRLAESYMASSAYPIDGVWRMFSTPNNCGSVRAFGMFSRPRASTQKEIVTRSKSFASIEQFRSEVAVLAPHRVDVGAIYAYPIRHGQPQSEAVSREFCVDIDIDAYDADAARHRKAARSCCSSRRYCRKCWPLVSTAAVIVTRRLAAVACAPHERDAVGRGVAWFYSGGRGVHLRAMVAPDSALWSVDRRSRESMATLLAPADARSESDAAMCRNFDEAPRESLRMLVGVPGPGGGASGAFFAWYSVHHARVAIEALSAAMTDVKSRGAAHPRLVDLERAIASGYGRDGQLVSEVRRITDAELRDAQDSDGELARCGAIEVVFTAAVWCMYPRIDHDVTVQATHLLRAPMGIHSMTGRLGCLISTGFNSDNEIAGFYPDDDSPQIVSATPVSFDDNEKFARHSKRFNEWVSSTF